MKTRRVLLLVGLGAAFAIGSMPRVIAQPKPASDASSFPNKPVRIIVTFAAGSATDIMTRHLVPRMSQALSQSVVVENRVGAAGVLGSEAIMRLPPDGYTIAMSAVSAHAIAHAVRPHNMPYDTIRDFTLIGRACTSTNVVVVHPSIPVRTLPELIEYSKKVPGGVRFASGGIGGSNHLAGEMMTLRTGAKFTHVPYSNANQAVGDVVAGHVPMMIYTVALLPHIKDGRVRALAVTAAERQPQLPDVPTAVEQGATGVVANAWFGLFGPAGMPEAVRDRLYAALREALLAPDVGPKLLDFGLTPAPLAPAEYRAFIEQDTSMWRDVVKAANLKIE